MRTLGYCAQPESHGDSDGVEKMQHSKNDWQVEKLIILEENKTSVEQSDTSWDHKQLRTRRKKRRF